MGRVLSSVRCQAMKILNFQLRLGKLWELSISKRHALRHWSVKHLLSFFAAASFILNPLSKVKMTWNYIPSGNKSDDDAGIQDPSSLIPTRWRISQGIHCWPHQEQHGPRVNQVQRTPLQIHLTQSPMSLKKQVLHVLIAGDVHSFTGSMEATRASDRCVDSRLCDTREAVSTSIPQYQHTGCHQGVSQESPDGHEIHKVFQVEEKGHNSCRKRGRWERKEKKSVTRQNMCISGALMMMQHTYDCCSGLGRELELPWDEERQELVHEYPESRRLSQLSLTSWN